MSPSGCRALSQDSCQLIVSQTSQSVTPSWGLSLTNALDTSWPLVWRKPPSCFVPVHLLSFQPPKSESDSIGHSGRCQCLQVLSPLCPCSHCLPVTTHRHDSGPSFSGLSHQALHCFLKKRPTSVLCTLSHTVGHSTPIASHSLAGLPFFLAFSVVQ